MVDKENLYLDLDIDFVMQDILFAKMHIQDKEIEEAIFALDRAYEIMKKVRRGKWYRENRSGRLKELHGQDPDGTGTEQMDGQQGHHHRKWWCPWRG